jgi:hypothetical protein
MKDTREWVEENGIPFEITKQEVKDMAKEPCYYCGDVSEDYCVDAVDVVTGFVQGNVVPCCQACNRFKGGHHLNDFLRIMCNIGATHASSLETHVPWTPVYEFVDKAKDLNSCSFSVYKSNAKILSRDFQMTKEQFERLVRDPCHYCGILRLNANGIDRVDSSKGYLSNNIVTCCGPCNWMKKHFAYTLFVGKAIKIMQMWASRFNASAGSFDVSTESSAHKAGEE